MSIRIKSEIYELELVDDKIYTPNSTDNLRAYDHVFYLPDKYEVSTQHGIICSVPDGDQWSCIVIARGFSTIHEHSFLIMGNRLFIAVGCYVCCLKLPILELEWNLELDFSSVFEIYWLPKKPDFISHGEVNISRITQTGELVWSCSGKDIFSEGFEISPTGIDAIDFNHEKYHIDLENGKVSLISG